ncbi:hypothetical protein E0Z10_g8653 [Xylaria hypoxylon]|uniref:Uncharacterized protein n=1 Tax=Xylaria hypoxylon TaxID=37992 RepID=A0A4Z0YMB1_9PEZI|nr:hypothetical protein E0Z10_g8653 [Xylaria hypoxylon]
MTTQNVPDQDGPEDIPALTSMAPSIFVPTNRDFTKTPPPLSDDPISCVETTIKELDWHAQRVEENMIAMLAREAELVRRTGHMERAQYDLNNRPSKHQQRMVDHDLLLEELILREDEDAVLNMLRDAQNRDNEDAGSSREGPRERWPHYRSHSPPLPPPRRRSSWAASEYADLNTLRRERMFRLDVDASRETPRSAALAHVFNLIKWGWDDQIEGHRAFVKKEKEERRAKVHRQMKENPLPPATTPVGPAAPMPPIFARAAPRRLSGNSVDFDAMDIDL